MRSDPVDITHVTSRIRPTVAIVGAGAAGTLTALHLLRRLGRDRTAADVVLVDPALGDRGPGLGVAYGTTDRRHLLNVPAGRLSALPDEPDDLLAWARCQIDADTSPHDFLPRADYGRYLADTLAAEADLPSPARLRRVPQRAVAVEGQTLRLDDGSTLEADQVVLAPGVFAPGTGWAPPALLVSDRFVPDPWAPGALDALKVTEGDVLLVGTGLTTVDVALSLARPGRTLHAVSRRGRLPKVHGRPRPASPPVDLPVDGGLDALRRAVAAHVEATVRATGDWRPAIDGLRPHTQRLWAALTPAERRAFLDSDAVRWDTHRHRMPRSSAASIARLRADGDLGLHRGTVADVHDDGSALVVRLSCGTTVRVAAVVNCTGPLGDVSLVGDPLLTGLLADGLATPGPCDLGIATDAEGRVVAGSGGTGPLWAIGALRRGDLWETTAIPEIRSQAVALADRIGTELAAPARVRRRPRDLMGLPLSTSADAAVAYNDGLGRVLRVQSGAEDAFRTAVSLDPQFALAHAALALLGHEGGAGTDVTAALGAARAAVRRRGDDRERSLVDVIGRRVQDCRGVGAAALVSHIGTHPRDALAVSAAVPTIAFSGVTDVQQEAWALVEGLAPAYGTD